MTAALEADTAIALIGLAGRFPKARDVDQFWTNLCDGVEGISFFSDDELEAAGIDFPRGDPNCVKARGVLEQADGFDAAFFGMNPREAEVTDPQHRVFLECAWAALENAGYAPGTCDSPIGVFAGMSMSTYLSHNLLTRPDVLAQLNEHQLMLGNDKDFLPTRVSYKLNLRGPSVNIQTACSTSLVAVCVACQNLLAYECDLALAGAVSLGFPQKRAYLHQPGGIASPDGHCRAFDAKAAGTVPGEGVGIVVLKRLADALADHDTVYAVIRGFAMNNDGSAKVGYTAPSVEGQAEVIAAALGMADVAPDTIGYVETHGTGTPLGDPIEIEGLTTAFRAGTDQKQFCAIGSVKTNIGHLDVAAGVAGLIKTALALHHKQLPASLHFEAPNPKIDFSASPFFVNSRLADWKRATAPRRAGVSSFGIGGTNAHVVLEETPPPQSAETSRPVQLLLLSAKSAPALDQAAANLAKHLERTPGVPLADAAYTLQVGRSCLTHRRMVVCRNANEAIETLKTHDPKRSCTQATDRERARVVFMFPGQGAQKLNMGRELYQHEPVFREHFEHCREILHKESDVDVRAALYPAPEEAEAAGEALNQTGTTQPALFALEYALARLWMHWGIVPDAMVGHSLGEYVAACLADVFTLEDALKLVAARAQMMQQLPPGAMVAVRAPEAQARSLLGDRLSLATVNGAALCVISGPLDAVESLRRNLEHRGMASTVLQTSHAFHSAMMEPIMKPFTELTRKIFRRPPKLPLVSNVTGTWLTAEQAMAPDYWATHLRQTVRFADGLAELLREPGRAFLEVGPGTTLATLARQHPAWNGGSAAVSTLPHGKSAISDEEGLLSALGRLWLSGATVNWGHFWNGEPRRRVPLPTYPFERKRFWVEPGQTHRPPVPAAQPAAAREAGGKPANLPITSRPADAPSATCQEEIAASLRRILGDMSGLNFGEISADATFTDVGFDSLALTQVSYAIEKQLGVQIAFRQLLEDCPTLNTLATCIAKKLPLNHEQPAAHRSPDPATVAQEPLESGGPTALPLTDAQREVWFASQLSDAASCAFNECRLLHLHGPLDTEALIGALRTLTARHEALRATFSPTGESQVIQTGEPPEVERLELAGLGFGDATNHLERLAFEEARRPFDLVRGPLLRAGLARISNSHHVLMLTVHHVVCDGHSLGVLLNELASLYSAARRGEPASLPPAPQLSEYARWQASRADGPARATDEAFWVKQFAEAPPALELPTDSRRPPLWTFEGARAGLLLPPALGEELRQLGARNGCTLFATLLAGYSVLLHKLSGQSDIVVGVPVADRGMPNGSALVAHCVNFLPLRLKLDEQAAFGELVVWTQKIFLDAFEHQRFAFGSLVQKLNLTPNGGRMPLVSTTFNVQRLGQEPFFEGLHIELQASPYSFTHFDLGFDVTETRGAFQLNCRYNQSLFAAETVRRWLSYYQTVLANVVAEPRQTVAGLSLLSADERRRMLAQGNPSSRSRARVPAPRCVHHVFEEQCERAPDRVAVTFEDRELSYGELNRRANRLANRLRELDVGPEVRVGLCLERSFDTLIAILAVLKAGGAYVPLDLAYPAERLEFILRDAQAPVLLTQRALLGRLPELTSRVICIEDELASRPETPADNPQVAVRPENLAYVIYTSGSTGQPKGVLVTHQNVARLFSATEPWFQFTARDVWTLFHSYAFDFSVWEIWGALLQGGRLVVVPHWASRDPGAFLKLLAREQVTILNQTPSAFRQLIQAEAAAPETQNLALRFVIFGGEALEFSSLKPWFDRHGDQTPRLVNMYGITETTVHVTYRPVNAADIGAGSVIGEPIPDLQVYILDRHRQPVPPGVPGEMYVGGGGVARGYLNRPDLTSERFLPDPFSDEASQGSPASLAGRLYRTGDRARWLSNGDIEYLGRIDRQVKIRGHRIELGEIEAALRQHPALRDCVTVARQDAPGELRLVSYIVPELDQASLTASEWRRFLQSKLPEYMVPSAVVQLEALPLTPNGKLDREALPAPGPLRPESKQALVPPSTPTEEILASIWREVLQLAEVGARDNFFDLGGHSLLMTRVVARVREAFQVELSIRRFFETPTLSGLALAIEELIVAQIGRMSDEQARRLARSRE